MVAAVDGWGRKLRKEEAAARRMEQSYAGYATGELVYGWGDYSDISCNGEHTVEDGGADGYLSLVCEGAVD